MEIDSVAIPSGTCIRGAHVAMRTPFITLRTMTHLGRRLAALALVLSASTPLWAANFVAASVYIAEREVLAVEGAPGARPETQAAVQKAEPSASVGEATVEKPKVVREPETKEVSPRPPEHSDTPWSQDFSFAVWGGMRKLHFERDLVRFENRLSNGQGSSDDFVVKCNEIAESKPGRFNASFQIRLKSGKSAEVSASGKELLAIQNAMARACNR